MSTAPPLEEHRGRRDRFRAEAEGHDARANRVSFLRLVTFGAAATFALIALIEGSFWGWPAAGAAAMAFVISIAVHLRILARRDQARVRAAVHERHVMRLEGRASELKSTGAGLLPPDHPYAGDLDLIGPGSLFQWLDVTHTVRGGEVLARWLAGPADRETIRARQEAVRELAPAIELRQELEASARAVAGDDKLDHRPFLAFTRHAPFVSRTASADWAARVLPVLTVGLAVAWRLGVLPWWAWLPTLGAQIAVVLSTGRAVNAALDLAASRRGFAEAYVRMLKLVEEAKLEAPALRAIQERLKVSGVPPSATMRRLDRWLGFADLRTQFPLHLVANLGALWDLHCLRGLERWNAEVGSHVEGWMDALGELEALSSLATLAYGDPSASYPEIVEPSDAFVADALAHPLLPAATRVANDVALRGPGTALIVTGSNMAGKSTLLRAVGLNVALALAGGPVIARSLRVPVVRLRASMRIEDSLQRGASYFHAELTRLRQVVAEAGAEPKIFFLLDELLRGTNARARHLGARAVLMHLLSQGATGLVATHDIALSELEPEHPDRVANLHFTDVFEDGEMKFDYRLRPGVVKTSNALRLLKMAGIEVPDDTSLSG